MCIESTGYFITGNSLIARYHFSNLPPTIRAHCPRGVTEVRPSLKVNRRGVRSLDRDMLFLLSYRM